jgi:hypothetical protein
MIKLVTRNLTTLPTGLLPLAKAHMRIDSAFEDTLILSVLARAIGAIEDDKEITINPTTMTWTPAAADFFYDVATLPARPASAVTVTQGTPPVDVTANYTLGLKWNSLHGITIQMLKGAAADDLTVTLTLGFASAAAIFPSVESMILLVASHLYEHREILVPGSSFKIPDFGDQWWSPRI